MELLSEAEPARLGAWLEGAGRCQELPLDGEVQPLILQPPDVAGQFGSDPLA